MNDRQQAHIDYFLDRLRHWRGIKRDEATARMLAARDADREHPLLSEDEGAEVFDRLRQMDERQVHDETQ